MKLPYSFSVLYTAKPYKLQVALLNQKIYRGYFYSVTAFTLLHFYTFTLLKPNTFTTLYLIFCMYYPYFFCKGIQKKQG